MGMNDRTRAPHENSICRFLVACCEEDPSFEASGMELSGAYLQFYRQKTPYPHSNEHAIAYLAAGLRKETRPTPIPSGKLVPVVWFVGVRLKPQIHGILQTAGELQYEPLGKFVYIDATVPTDS